MGIEVLGIDPGKAVCSLAGLDATGAVVYRKRLQRYRLLDFLEGLDPCIVAMEAYHLATSNQRGARYCEGGEGSTKAKGVPWGSG